MGYLTGMTVLTYSEDPVAAAKVAEDFAKENKKLEILGGAMGENALDRAGVEACRKGLRVMNSSRLSLACLAHLLRTSLAQLAHLLRISHPSCRPSRKNRKLRKQLLRPAYG